MQYELIGAIGLIILNIWVTISMIKGLSEHIESLLVELVEDLPPALGEAMSGSMEGMSQMADVNPIQMAIAQMLPKMFEKPAIEAKLVERSATGQFTKDNL
jgi:hypothetical protein